MTTAVAVAGATGRMGRLVCGIVEAAEDFELVARLDSRSDPGLMDAADVVVDVTLPEASPGIVDHAVNRGMGVLVGTSGWSAERIASLERRAGEQARVLIVPNFSIGSVLGSRFAALAARFYDSIEIVEAHHGAKADSPSGTAVRTAELIERARSGLAAVDAPNADQPARGQLIAGVPVHSMRMSGVLARQSVILGGPGETLTIVHDTVSPEAYAQGILLALRALPGIRGVRVGLDAVLDLGDGAGDPGA